MQISAILQHFLSRADWVDPDKTVDRIIIGDPEKEVDHCLVTWMPSFQALRYAADKGYELAVCHEPTFWNHFDDIPEAGPRTAEKLEFIQRHDITILRNHDCWDRWPEVGIPWAWARFLGISGEPVAFGQDGYQHRYDLEATTVEAFALQVATKCASIGEPSVQVTGGLKQAISSIGVGTGCACDINTFLDMGCDCSLVCDDGSIYWADIQMAEDINHPVIRVNHGTSEEPGMVTLTDYINQNLGIRAEHLPHGSTFRLIG